MGVVAPKTNKYIELTNCIFVFSNALSNCR